MGHRNIFPPRLSSDELAGTSVESENNSRLDRPIEAFDHWGFWLWIRVLVGFGGLGCHGLRSFASTGRDWSLLHAMTKVMS